MYLVKIGKIPGLVDISEQKVREFVENEVWEEGKHYYINTHLNHKLFDMDAILTWIKGNNDESKKVMEIAQRMIG